MSDGFDGEPRDDALARGLRGLAPSEFELDPDQTLGAMRPALRRAGCGAGWPCPLRCSEYSQSWPRARSWCRTTRRLT